MNLPEGVNYEDVTVNATVTGIEDTKVQATAYFTPPTEETKHIHEKMLQMCLDDLNAKMEKTHGNSSTCLIIYNILNKFFTKHPSGLLAALKK